MATGPYPPEHRRFLPPELRAAIGESDRAEEPEPEGAPAVADVVPSRVYRFIHAPAWKYIIGGVSLILLLLLFGMVCSPTYWRF